MTIDSPAGPTACEAHNMRVCEQREAGLRSQLAVALATAEALREQLGEASAERDRLSMLVNSPEIIDFGKAVQLEAAHQRERWGAAGDAGKTDADWFWLIGYLAGKALGTDVKDAESRDKKLHRIITVAAAACNWHAAKLKLTDMRPGILPPPGETT